MSLGRAASSTPRHAGGGGCWAGNTPWRHLPRQPTGRPPARPRVCCAVWEVGRGGSGRGWSTQRLQIHRTHRRAEPAVSAPGTGAGRDAGSEAHQA